MKYFEHCKTIEEVKKEYKRLAIKLHPDHGGDTAEFQRMANEYEAAFNRCKDYHESANGETYYEESHETPEEFAEIIAKLVIIPGLDIEICGRWIWIGGDTYAAREDLKAAGCRWASKKKMWYWHRPEDRTGAHRTKSMNYIRERYGSEKVESTKVLQIA